MDATYISSMMAKRNPNCMRSDQSFRDAAETRAETSITDKSKGPYSGLQISLGREPNGRCASHLTSNDFSGLHIRSEVPDANVESEAQKFGAVSLDLRKGADCREPKAPEIDSKSESGWTTYLNTSLDSMTGSLTGDERRSSRGNEALCKAVAACSEDLSTASDASSGPEQPCFGHQYGAGVKTKSWDIEMPCKRSLEAADLGGIGGSERYRWKRERLQSSRLEAVELSGLEDTASSSLQVSLREGSDQPNRGITSCTNCLNGIGSILSRVSPEWGSDAVIQRLKTLEALIPDVKEVNEKDMLRITVDYVRALESRVKTLDKASFRERDDGGTMPDKVGGEDPKARRSTLQDKGLCLVPISVVANSL